eukprot:COSAG01_NODE_58443_length_306_cov_0.714976_1_plen_47_part_01
MYRYLLTGGEALNTLLARDTDTVERVITCRMIDGRGRSERGSAMARS